MPVVQKGPSCFVWQDEPEEAGSWQEQLSPEMQEFWRLVFSMTPDEQALLLRRARKMMHEGREEHGALVLAKETRTPQELREEQADEQADADFYEDLAEMVEERDRERFRASSPQYFKMDNFGRIVPISKEEAEQHGTLVIAGVDREAGIITVGTALDWEDTTE